MARAIITLIFFVLILLLLIKIISKDHPPVFKQIGRGLREIHDQVREGFHEKDSIK
jgi:hypothetical protein